MTSKTCMNTSCVTQAAATLAFRVVFAYKRRGFPPKKHTAWVGVYVCQQCATQEAADDIMHNAWNLGEMVRYAIHADTLDRKATVYGWEARTGADEFFAKVEKQAEEEAARRRVSIVDAANDTVQ